MSSPYHWHDEAMVQQEMRELYREIEHIRLLHDASQTKPGWFARQFTKFGNWMSRAGASMVRRHSVPVPQYYQSTSFKFSP